MEEDINLSELNVDSGSNQDIQKKKRNNHLYSNLVKGFSEIIKMCSEMEENQESCRIYQGEIFRENDLGEKITGKYRFGIQIGNLPVKSRQYKAEDCKLGCEDDESEVRNNE